MADAEKSDSGYTIDELAALSRVPSRTIRFYQAKRALPRPEIRGRVAHYGDVHLERLKLIASLQDRGLSIDAIRELTTRIDKGELDVNEWLGLEAQLRTPWANDQPRTVTEAELYELAGVKRPALIADLLRVKLMARHGEVFLVTSPALLAVAMKLEAAGVDLDTAVRGSEIIRKHLARAADELATHFVSHALRDDDGDQGSAKVFEALRPMGFEAVRVVFGQEMERVLRNLVSSGKSAALPKRAKRRGK